MHGGGAWGLRASTTVMAMMVALAMMVAGCSDDDAPERARAEVPTDDTSTTTNSTTTSTTTTTTEATTTTVDPDAAEFEPLYADPELDPEAQIEAAYLHHWDILLDAYRTGRTDYLHLVYTDEALPMRTAEIGRLIAEDFRVDGHIEHNYAINLHGSDAGNVIDGYWNHLAAVDASTGEPLADPSGDQVVFEFTMRKVGDQWLVAFVEEHIFN